MRYIPAIVLAAVFVAFSVDATAQIKVNNETALTDDQRTVLPFLEPVQKAILDDDLDALIAMFELTGGRLSLPQERGIATFSARLRDRSDIFSCIIFDTACAREYFSGIGEKLRQDLKAPRAMEAMKLSQVFISVREFLQIHKNEMQVTFQPQVAGSIQAELHIPRRPDADEVPPPFGLYESLTLGFLKTTSGWKINKIFPEPYQYLSSFF